MSEPVPDGAASEPLDEETYDPLAHLTASELLRVAETGKVLALMGERKTNRIVVDYIPARTSWVVPRGEPDDPPLEAFPPLVIPITFKLEDSMFGGSVFVALTVADRVLTKPFVFGGYDDLAKATFNH